MWMLRLFWETRNRDQLRPDPKLRPNLGEEGSLGRTCNLRKGGTGHLLSDSQ